MREPLKFWQRAEAGGLAGFSTGLLVGPAEGLKVWQQVTPSGERRYFSPELLRQLARVTLPFSAIFSVVCALEFSVNDSIGEHYGKVAGLSASAATGAGFLTAADHLMLRNMRAKESALQAIRNLHAIHPCALWTGFCPMVGREAIFMLSVTMAGPALAKLAQKDQAQQNPVLTYAGRLASGVVTTVISQPLDSVARKMQMELVNDPSAKPLLLKTLRHCTLRQLMQGAGPRVGLASVGGATVGFFYDLYSKQLFSSPEEVNRAVKGAKR